MSHTRPRRGAALSDNDGLSRLCCSSHGLQLVVVHSPTYQCGADRNKSHTWTVLTFEAANLGAMSLDAATTSLVLGEVTTNFDHVSQ